MNLSQGVEVAGIGAVEVDGNHRQSRLLDELDDIGLPGLVFDGGFVADGRTGIFFLIGGHFARGEEADGAAVGDVPEGGPDAVDAAGVLRPGQVVHREKTFFEIGDQREQESG